MTAGDDGADGKAPVRRLRLLPEVLPDPTPGFAEGSPRARTLAHARRLVALAAASSAIGAACTKEGAPTIVRDDTPSGKTTKTDSTPTTTVTATPSDAAPTATASTITAPSIPPTGYAVVDPMPPPAKCPGLAGSIKATAVWKPGGPGGSMLVELRLPRSTRADVRYLHTTPPVPYGGTITTTTWTGGDVVLTLLPDKGAGYLGVYVPAACALGDERINVEITLTGSPAAGTPVAVALYDSY